MADPITGTAAVAAAAGVVGATAEIANLSTGLLPLLSPAQGLRYNALSFSASAPSTPPRPNPTQPQGVRDPVPTATARVSSVEAHALTLAIEGDHAAFFRLKVWFDGSNIILGNVYLQSVKGFESGVFGTAGVEFGGVAAAARDPAIFMLTMTGFVDPADIGNFTFGDFNAYFFISGNGRFGEGEVRTPRGTLRANWANPGYAFNV